MCCSSAGALRFPFPCLFTMTLSCIRSLNLREESSYFSSDCPPVSSFPSSATSSPVGSINMTALDLVGQFALCTNNLKWGQRRKNNTSMCNFVQVSATGRSFSSMRVAPQKNGIAHRHTHTHTKLHHKTRQLAKSVKPRINNPSPPNAIHCALTR